VIAPWLVRLLYLGAAVLFILGLKRLQSPETARRGNALSATGMLLAIVVTLLDQHIVSFGAIIAGLVVGSTLGLTLAYRVKMTAMPQMVALLNGSGGGASLLVAAAEFLHMEERGAFMTYDVGGATQLGVLIGAVTVTGSVIAFAKLQELIGGRAVVFPFQKIVNALIFLSVIALAVWLIADPAAPRGAFYAMIALSLVLGVLLVIPIGGADMPVVMSVLSSYSGMAAALSGFVIGNEVLIVSGALVGSSGIILSQFMC
jgi:NAD(P) transhydrogenase subunit beta